MALQQELSEIIKAKGKLTPEKEAELFSMYKLDDPKLAEELWNHLLTLIMYIYKYVNGLSFEEFISLSWDAVLTGVSKYDKTRGNFSAYYGWCLKSKVGNYIRKNQAVQAPLNSTDDDSYFNTEIVAPEIDNTEDVYNRLEKLVETKLNKEERKIIEQLLSGTSITEIRKINGGAQYRKKKALEKLKRHKDELL